MLDGFGVGFAGIAFALLFAFMGYYPSIRRLPLIASGKMLYSKPGDLQVSVFRHSINDREYLAVNRAIVPDDQISRYLIRELQSGRYKRIVIEADRHAKLGSLTPVFKEAQAFKIPIAFASESVSILEQQSFQKGLR